MKHILVRHGETNATRFTSKNFGPKGAPLNEQGIESARNLKKKLENLGIDFSQEVAVSDQQRTQQTAIEAGFINLVINPLLNEVNTSNPARTNELVAQRDLPEEAREAGRLLLADPPEQHFWFTHGQITAAVLDQLGYTDREEYVLGFNDTFEIEL